MIPCAVVTVLAGYFIGSINFAVLFSKWLLHRDIRSFGSGNAGATNMLRTAGVFPGLLTFFCDAAKGVFAAWLGKVVFGYIGAHTVSAFAVPIYGAYLCGIACMLGHVFPFFFNFRGGKAVSTGLGVFLICTPIPALIALVCFAVLLLLTKIVSLSSMVSTVFLVVLSFFFLDRSAAVLPQVFLSIVIGLIVLLKHKDNFLRLLNGEEKPITFGRK